MARCAAMLTTHDNRRRDRTALEVARSLVLRLEADLPGCGDELSQQWQALEDSMNDTDWQMHGEALIGLMAAVDRAL